MTPAPRLHLQARAAFTLVELSIVLVIVGLLVGGVLVGQDLIAGAALRSQITQLDKYSSAVNAYRDKYFAIPGDMKQANVTQWGFAAAPIRQGGDSNGSPGRGDGDGTLEGSTYGGNSSGNFFQGGETLWFWEDLSTNSGLMEGGYKTAGDTAVTANGLADIQQYVPGAKIASNMFVMVGNVSNVNYFLLSAIDKYSCAAAPCFASGYMNTSTTTGITALQAEQMDIKVDDGAPASGAVQYATTLSTGLLTTGTAGASPSTCFNTTTNQYYGGNPATVCPLIFKFQ